MSKYWWLKPVGFTCVVVAIFVLGVAMAWIPDRWDNATVIKICDGTFILKLEDGSLWARRAGGYRAYRVEDAAKVCASD